MVKYTYDAWGNHIATGSDGTVIYHSARGVTGGYENHIGNLNPIRYRGYYYDTETGLYYCQSRYYDPEVGRWLNADDINYLDPESLNGLNLYAYCGNNPVMLTDSTGTFAITLTFLSCAAVALFAVGAVAYVEIQFHPIQTTLELVGQGLLWLGTQTWNGLQWLFSQWKPGTWPGDDPTVSPGDDFTWRGPGEIGSDRGEWYNPITGDQLHPDLFHKPPKGPHWGWKNKIKKILQDIFKNGGPPTLA